MNVTIEKCEGVLSTERLEQVERRLGFRLPDDYRVFLLAHNGGRPRPSVFHFKHERGPYTDSCIDWFLAIYDGEYDNFETFFERYKVEQVRLPAELVPIAHDPGGNLICIAVEGAKRGAVFFWDHEKEEDVPMYDNVYLIADSFSAFLEGLQSEP